eukprot:CAMPEP_0117077542 /NCGR_PEP_ID=MMETSP0472-20121206/54677_1 /TAXON_ID=693140 ORGANISM="Tiarina fusus, Strain LIS" /NCGR_SAMPLE_ID=MMETSP0472 /ASSEMBLY_ACC=CAM_ASM_000603 /LENGTH=202 /DNA_ID=CAMNT_0004803925 /DNA_START=159 /DNA_END=767 /DNA_ORIENTATION=-
MTSDHMNNSNNNISSEDVLCGRGGATNNHVGNKKFRSIVAEYQEVYLQAKKKEKAGIAKQIVERVRQNGGRFLKRDTANNTWVEVAPKKATEKTSQALREGLDVKHKTFRPEKMIRPESMDSEERNPRKRPRLVEGTVAEASPLQLRSANNNNNNVHNNVLMLGGESIPDLNEEHETAHAGFLYFQQPRQISQSDCADIAAV